MKLAITGITAALLVACVIGAKADTALSQLSSNGEAQAVPAATDSVDTQAAAPVLVTAEQQGATISKIAAELSKIESRLADPNQQRPGASEAKQISAKLETMSQDLSTPVSNKTDKMSLAVKSLKIRIGATLTTMAAVDQVVKGPGAPGGGGHGGNPMPSPQPHPQPAPQPAPQPHPQPTPEPHPQPAPQPHPQPIHPIPPYNPVPGDRCVEQDGLIDSGSCDASTPWLCYAQFSNGNRVYGSCVSDETQCYSYGEYAVPCNY